MEFFTIIINLGELPLIQNLNNLPAGRYVFNVSATDIYRLHDAFVIEYTSKTEITWSMSSIMANFDFLLIEEPLKLSLINSSPRIWAGQIIADFTVNRGKGQYSVVCDLGRQKQKNCMQKFNEKLYETKVTRSCSIL